MLDDALAMFWRIMAFITALLEAAHKWGKQLLPAMLDDTLAMFWRIMAFIIALFGAAYTIIYYTISISVLAAGVCFGFLALCIIPAVFQFVVEHLPLKQYFDRRLQKDFINKIKNIEYKEKKTRARLIQLMGDVKLQNEANNKVLKEIRINEAIIKRKVRGFASCVVDRYQIQPTIPGLIVPPHQEPEEPSRRPIIRWLFAQSLQLYHHERSIAKYEAQISGELMKLQQLDEEHICLRDILDDINSKRSRVMLLNDLPKPYRVSASTRKYCSQFDHARMKPSPYPHFERPSDWESRVNRLAGLTSREPEIYQVRLDFPPMTKYFTVPPRLAVGTDTSFGAPMFSAPVQAPPLFAAPITTTAPCSFSTSLYDPPPSVAPFRPAFGPPTATPTTPAAAPTLAPPAENHLSLSERMTDPTGLRAPLPASNLAAPAPIQSDEEIQAERKAARLAEMELARDLKAARAKWPSRFKG
ncbi:hypothetical protein SLS53_004081 [Cytospora paraplurivora]|uniref:Uncharacterized protein n=1 Tax=Cytospora paraplurivora TaxID=2898453 RepID=A0AAN9UBC7_9PEZI